MELDFTKVPIRERVCIDDDERESMRFFWCHYYNEFFLFACKDSWYREFVSLNEKEVILFLWTNMGPGILLVSQVFKSPFLT